ncbi:hypothetical protein [Nocardia gipuzkoensis]
MKSSTGVPIHAAVGPRGGDVTVQPLLEGVADLEQPARRAVLDAQPRGVTAAHADQRQPGRFLDRGE